MKRFIDFDKRNKILYDNLWIDDLKIVIKIPIIINEDTPKEIIIGKFNLSECLYLLEY
ncbi:MAG: hypothetical protein ACTSVV_19095 [Promethearchaeota archaeon]